jgi:D-alanyl-D-alanine carboxypeptidase
LRINSVCCEHHPTNQLTLIIWSNPTVSLDGQQTANTLFVKMLDHVYVVSPLR